ncbi:PaaI family thioesterase [Roseovarius aestuarii]|nr:PaaI family thioesterase [Roseovarius aestuarii]
MNSLAMQPSRFSTAQFIEFRRDDPLMNFIGETMIAQLDDKTVLRVTCNPQAANPQGILHGGILSSVCDVGMYEAAKRSLKSECVTLSQEMKFLRAGRANDPIHVICEITKPGRRVVFTSAVVVQADIVISSSTAQWMPIAV